MDSRTTAPLIANRRVKNDSLVQVALRAPRHHCLAGSKHGEHQRTIYLEQDAAFRLSCLSWFSSHHTTEALHCEKTKFDRFAIACVSRSERNTKRERYSLHAPLDNVWQLNTRTWPASWDLLYIKKWFLATREDACPKIDSKEWSEINTLPIQLQKSARTHKLAFEISLSPGLCLILARTTHSWPVDDYSHCSIWEWKKRLMLEVTRIIRMCD